MESARTATTVRASASRAARVAKGLASPATRGRYLDALKSRLRDERPGHGVERCLVCKAPSPRHRTIHSASSPDKVRYVRICGSCGHISIPDNRNDYTERDYSQLPSSGRTGHEGKPGRDYHIAALALEGIAREDVEVLLYGVGASRDNHTIIGLPKVRSVAIGDIMKLRDDGEFVDLTKRPPRKFDLVIASEVIEHFRDPVPDFRTLFGFVKRNGLVVCATNVYGGNDLSRDRYIFYSDHTSYYTPAALHHIAMMYGMHIDFRMPIIGAGMRKRYIFFTRSRATLDRLSVYFGSRAYAPSESAYRLRAVKRSDEKRST